MSESPHGRKTASRLFPNSPSKATGTTPRPQSWRPSGTATAPPTGDAHHAALRPSSPEGVSQNVATDAPVRRT
eukprot:5958299-Pyramimonas_sp.AAC.1